MNCKNANQELGFDKFSKCDYNLHWSFSNFNRMLIAAEQISRLPFQAEVLELGAGSSDLENIVKNNFNRNDIRFIKVDGDSQYEKHNEIKVADITSEMFDFECKVKGTYDAIVFMEVIEHLNRYDAEKLIEKISGWLGTEGLLLFTTPTPPHSGMYEDRVWPTDHEKEFEYSDIYYLINKFFKINKEIGWSLEERDYNKLLENNDYLNKISSKLKNAFPESYVRAIIACLAPVQANRQIFFICKKRRIANGRPA